MFTLGLLTSMVLLAAPQTVARLDYQRGDGAEQCVDEAALKALVVERVGHEVWAEDAPLTVHVVIEKQDDGALWGHVAVLDGDGNKTGERDLRSIKQDCVDLSAAVALGISMVLDPDAVLGLLEPEPATTPPQAAVRPRRRAAGRLLGIVPPRPRDAPSFSGFVDVGGGGVVGLGGGLSPVVLVASGIHHRMLSLALEGQWMAPATLVLAPNARVTTAVQSIGVVPCLDAGVLTACGVARVGGFVASSRGLAGARTIVRPLVMAGGRLGLQIPITQHLWLTLHAQGLGLPYRVRLTDSGTGKTLLESLPVALELAAGLRLRLP